MVRSKRISERCEQTSDRTSNWPIARRIHTLLTYSAERGNAAGKTITRRRDSDDFVDPLNPGATLGVLPYQAGRAKMNQNQIDRKKGRIYIPLVFVSGAPAWLFFSS